MRYFLLLLACGLATNLAVAQGVIGSDTQTAGVAKRADSAQEAIEEFVQAIPADTTRAILKQFKIDNPEAREHKLGLISEAYTEDASNPALKLERLWVGGKGALLELVGLPRKGQRYSAAMSPKTLRLVNLKTSEAVESLGVDGAELVLDQRGNVVLVLKPGETMYLLMGPVDDMQAMSLNYTGWDNKEAKYFDRIDPRFRERYDTAHQLALSTVATPDQLKDFLVEFARQDPDKKAPVVFMALINKMRAQNTFEGYYQAYLLIKDPADAKAAFKLARTDEHKAKMEDIAVATLVDKSRLLDLSFQLNPSTTSTGESGCGFSCNSNFNARRNVSGTLTVRAKQSASPIKLRLGTYQVVLNTELTLPRWGKQESGLSGNFDRKSDDSIKGTVTVVLAPPTYSATIPVDFGTVQVAYSQRGSSGSYTRYWAVGDAQAAVRYKSMGLVK